MTFSRATQSWLDASFDAPTPAQSAAWEAIGAGHHTLVVAPTGSGKTLAAFLWAIDQHLTAAQQDDAPGIQDDTASGQASTTGQQSTAVDRQASNPAGLGTAPTRAPQILYVSPLKALASDVERNLRSPLIGIAREATRIGSSIPEVTVGVRTGDTSQRDRQRMAKNPPDIIITTPESLFLMLTSSASAALARVGTVIVDEIHALAGTKRGAHLALSLERLDSLLPVPAQRIGLSATVTPAKRVAEFLSGDRLPADGGRPTRVVQPPATKHIDLTIEAVDPTVRHLRDSEDLSGDASGGYGAGAYTANDARAAGYATSPLDGGGESGAEDSSTKDRSGSTWPEIERRVVDLIERHRATLVFVNSRRTAEKLTARLNEEWARRHGVTNVLGDSTLDNTSQWPAAITAQAGAALGIEPVIARAHHGSMSRIERTQIEDALKSGRLPAVVATSSLELGIDMGAIDLVVQIGPPPSVASGLQRIGRAGHQVGETSHGVILTLHRGDLIPAAVTAQRMRDRSIEAVHDLTNPLDVLAQQVVAAVAVEDWDESALLALVRRAAPFAGLGDATWASVLDMLAGRYPSEDFAELRPRLTWDRATGTLSGRRGSALIAVTSGGTIPDRGLYPVVLAGGNDGPRRRSSRVGELDEEMVYESRVGDAITLGSSTWRIEEITPQQVIVTPAPGQPGRLPFWKGDGPGRPFELGAAIGAFTRQLDGARRRDVAGARTRLAEQGMDAAATGQLLELLAEQHESTGHLPDDRTVIIERFHDELGDWRIVIHSPFGSRVHAPWALVIGARIREQFGLDASVSYADDGIVLRMPPMGDADEPGLPAGDLLIDPADVFATVREQITGSPMFAARFREAAARALLLPRRKPGVRQPLWQQRHRAAQLLGVAAQYPDFPIVIEAVRECLRDDFDLASLVELMTAINAGRIRVLEVTTDTPSPFARSLLFSFTAQFMYDADAPLAERKAVALSLDPTLLAELLGGDDAPDLADLLDPAVVAQVSAEIARTAPDRRVTSLDGLWDLLRSHGPLTRAEIAARVDPELDGVDEWLAQESGRLVFLTRRPGSLVGGRSSGGASSGDEASSGEASRNNSSGARTDAEWWVATDDAARLRDALGLPLPAGLPQAYLVPVTDPLGDLARRYARTHGPFTLREFAAGLATSETVAGEVVRRLVRDGKLVPGPARHLPDAAVAVPREANPTDEDAATAVGSDSVSATAASADGITGTPATAGSGRTETWVDPDVLRRIRRRTLAVLRGQVEAVEPQAFARFVPHWQHLRGDLRGPDGVLQVVEQLAGARFPASALETFILPSRVVDYEPRFLDDLAARGEVIWCGHQSLPGARGDGIISLHLTETAALTLPAALPLPTAMANTAGASSASFSEDTLTTDLLHSLGRGGQFFDALVTDAQASADRVAELLWELVWSSRVTSDSFGSLREMIGARGGAHRSSRTAARARPGRGLRGLRALAHSANAAALNDTALNDTALNETALNGASVAGHSIPLATPGRSDTALRDILAARAGGRWSTLPLPQISDPHSATLRAHADVTVLLQRYGVVTRTPGLAEQVVTDTATMYRVLAELEQQGIVRRGYFVEGLGGAQFAIPGAIDELRRFAHTSDSTAADQAKPSSATDLATPNNTPAGQAALSSAAAGGVGSNFAMGDMALVRDGPPNSPRIGHEADVQVIAASDPANPFGVLLDWPQPALVDPAGSSHRPGRRAGAIVVLVDGAPILYLERGGRTLVVLEHSAAIGDVQADDAHLYATSLARETTPLDLSASALVAAVKAGIVSRATIRQVADLPALDAVRLARTAVPTRPNPSPVATAGQETVLAAVTALLSAGAEVHTQGIRLEGPRARR